MQKLAAEQCDMVVLGTIIRETIGGIATAKRLGFNPTFIGSSAAYTDLIHKLGGPAMNGLYATMTVPPDIFGGAEQTFSPTKRLGSNATRLSQLQENRWKVVSDYMQISQ